ncbi:MAG: cyclic nucleotide-binding domain-containing protein, partial [Ardenticatenaceae bacterium]
MLLQGISFFDGLADDEIEHLMSQLGRRVFSPGQIVLKEGEKSNALYVILSGTANVSVSDRHGVAHQISQVGPGSTLGEMWLFTHQPASALVRASSELETLVMSDSEFHSIATRFPIIYRNLGAILSERVARTSRQALEDRRSRVTMLIDFGGPPLLGYALACSVAWHTRRATLLLLFADEMPEELARLWMDGDGAQVRSLEDARELTHTAAVRNERAYVMLARPSDGFTPQMAAMAAEDLSRTYERVLVQLPPGAISATEENRTVCLAGLLDSVPEEERSRGRFVMRAWANAPADGRLNGNGVLHAPALIYTDIASLRSGVLSQDTNAGRVIGWAARDVARLKVGLALGAGSVKGYAHIGVWRFLERAGLKFDYLAGTSIGSAVASLYAIGYDTEEAANMVDTVGSAAFRLTLPFSSVLSSRGLRKRLKEIGREVRFEDLDTPLAVVAADVIAGREVVFRRGLVWP